MILKHTPVKVGLLLDDRKVPVWIEEIIQFLKNDHRFEICFVVLNNAPVKKKPSAFLYKVLRKLDEYLMRLPDSPFIRKEVDVTEFRVIKVFPLQKKYSDHFPDDVLEQIRSLQPDIMIRFGFRILRGEILTAAKQGILSLHHGSMEYYRGGPPAFWEVVNKEPTTTVSLQLLTQELDAGLLLDESVLNTFPYSFYRNQHRIYWAGEHLLKENLLQLVNDGVENYFQHKRAVQRKLQRGTFYKPPGNVASFKLICWYFFKNAGKQLHRKLFVEQWQIVVQQYAQSNGVNKLKAHQLLKPPIDREWADPFIIKQNEQYFLFFEEKFFRKRDAHIALFVLDAEGIKINSEPIVVLKDKVHLSYPFVFSHNGSFYMLPEAAASYRLTLYKAVNFPYDWMPCNILIDDLHVYDPTLLKHTDGQWYLLCTAKSNDRYSSNAYFHIYSSNELHASFKPHPGNPFYKDVRLARPAGAVFNNGKSLLRPAQICAPAYGNGIVMSHIKQLNGKLFEESAMASLPDFPWINLSETHTINVAGEMIVKDKLVTRFKFF